MKTVKTRLIPALFIKNGHIVRSEDFNYHQLIGNVVNEAARFNEWNVDELVYIDISRTAGYDLGRDDHKVRSYSTLPEMLELISKVCFMPLTFGGGIRKIEDIDVYISSGADKVTLNTAAYNDPQLVRNASEKYGAQCIVASIDYRVINKYPELFVNFGNTPTGVSVFDWIKECEEMGAGEIFLNCIDRDGKATGFDIETIGKACEITRLPVIGCGGAGEMDDFLQLARQTKVSGIAAGNFFHFTERSYPRVKQYLVKNGINVRK